MFSPLQLIRIRRCGSDLHIRIQKMARGSEQVDSLGASKTADLATKLCMEISIWGQFVARTSLDAFTQSANASDLLHAGVRVNPMSKAFQNRPILLFGHCENSLVLAMLCGRVFGMAKREFPACFARRCQWLGCFHWL